MHYSGFRIFSCTEKTGQVRQKIHEEHIYAASAQENDRDILSADLTCSLYVIYIDSEAHIRGCICILPKLGYADKRKKQKSTFPCTSIVEMYVHKNGTGPCALKFTRS